jgi:hypothetical protein
MTSRIDPSQALPPKPTTSRPLDGPVDRGNGASEAEGERGGERGHENDPRAPAAVEVRGLGA